MLPYFPVVQHDHSHGVPDRVTVAPQMQRVLLIAIAPFALGTVLGLIILWPSERPDVEGTQLPAQRFDAVVRQVDSRPCPDVPGQENFRCTRATVEITEGSDAGDSFKFDYSSPPNARAIEEGDRVVVGRADLPEGQGSGPQYFFLDFDRRAPLLALGVLFSAVVVALSRWRGLAALAGLGVSLLVLVKFVLPAILAGESPLLVACVGGAAIMFLALYLAHGLNATTTVAVLGTLLSLLVTGLLSVLFVGVSSFTGSGSEEAVFLQITQQQVNLEGLLLASIIIGTLGVLDDVTVTQASAVWELHRANPSYGIKRLYQAGIRIGRDHIASTVNTLVLAYAGASLPLLILFTLANRSFGELVTTEVVAEEVVRTLVGSIGLVASVPVTTGLASLVVSRGTGGVARSRPRGRTKEEAEEPFKVPRAEAEWRTDT